LETEEGLPAPPKRGFLQGLRVLYQDITSRDLKQVLIKADGTIHVAGFGYRKTRKLMSEAEEIRDIQMIRKLGEEGRNDAPLGNA
jgi:hypothetical protein